VNKLCNPQIANQQKLSFCALGSKALVANEGFVGLPDGRYFTGLAGILLLI